MARTNTRLRTKSSTAKSLILPDFHFEKKLWKAGFNKVAGCDEVGRGCFAGPVVAGCVVFPANLKIPQNIYINDSKKVTSKRRESASRWIKSNALAWGVGIGTVAQINKKGIVKATDSAFRRAIISVKNKNNSGIDYLLIDAFYIPYIRSLKVGRKNGFSQRKNPKMHITASRQLAIINGDEKSLSIAAASIIAKVYRDKLMTSLSGKYEVYGWKKNFGYGTKVHQEAIKKYGLTRFHRKQFVTTFFNNSFSSRVQ